MSQVDLAPNTLQVKRLKVLTFIYHHFPLPLEKLEKTIGTPPYYVDEDYPAGPGITEPLPE